MADEPQVIRIKDLTVDAIVDVLGVSLARAREIKAVEDRTWAGDLWRDSQAMPEQHRHMMQESDEC